MDPEDEFLHLLVYECERCGSPLSMGVRRDERNLEVLDATPFDVRCPCGWSRECLGLEARYHWVLLWIRRAG